MIPSPLHNPPRDLDAALRRPEVVVHPRPCEVCGREATSLLRHWSGALLDLCTTCVRRARRED